jgi:hypothetical protein
VLGIDKVGLRFADLIKDEAFKDAVRRADMKRGILQATHLHSSCSFCSFASARTSSCRKCPVS